MEEAAVANMKLMQAQARITELVEALEIAGHRNVALEQNQDRLQGEFDRVKAELTASNDALNMSNQRTEALTKERYEIKAQLDRAIAEAAAAKKAFEQVRNRKAELATFELVKKRNATLEADRTALLEEFDRLEGVLHGQKQTLEANLTELRDSLTARDQAVEEVHYDFETALAKVQGVQTRLDQELQRAAGDPESRMELKINDQAQAIFRMAGELDKANARVQDAMKTQQALETELTEQRLALQSNQDDTVDTKAELISVTAQLSAVTKERNALQNRIWDASGKQQQLVWELAAMSKELRRSTSIAEKHNTDMEVLQQEKTALSDEVREQAAQIAQLTRYQRKQMDRIDALQTEKVGLLGQIEAEKVKTARLEEDSVEQINQLKQEKAALESSLSDARAQLTPEEGGDADLKAVRARIAALTNAYHTVYAQKSAHTQADPSVLAELNRVSGDLFAEQSPLARLVEARGLYTVRPQDSLTGIARRVYGAGDRWQDIFQTNQHLLQDPDRLVPGLVLVIP